MTRIYYYYYSGSELNSLGLLIKLNYELWKRPLSQFLTVASISATLRTQLQRETELYFSSKVHSSLFSMFPGKLIWSQRSMKMTEERKKKKKKRRRREKKKKKK